MVIGMSIITEIQPILVVDENGTPLDPNYRNYYYRSAKASSENPLIRRRSTRRITYCPILGKLIEKSLAYILTNSFLTNLFYSSIFFFKFYTPGN